MNKLKSKAKNAQLNKVSKKDCMDAIDYLWGAGYSQEMGTDKRFYTEILLKKVANSYNIELIGESK